MSDKINIRVLPSTVPRVKTGPVQFEDDWSGIYMLEEMVVQNYK